MGDYFVCSKTDPVVETKAGKVRGFRLNTTYAFHGINYAEAVRFQMPQPVKPWKGIKNALAYGYVCPLLKQDEPNMEVLVPHRYWPQDEHCQNLNVWTQSLDPGAKKPVMVWLHGGGFSAGSAIEHVAYEGDHLSEFGDVVVVSVNHRLNILGYLDLSPFGEKYKNSANAGNADMVAALQWVHDNIAAFGGDPENVTIFGQSGGGMKVATLMNTPAADGEEYFATSLLFASARWGNGEGIYNYNKEAQEILKTMLHQADDGQGVNMFNKEHKMPVFCPIGNAATFSDPSYHLPAFYEVWAREAEQDNDFWSEAAEASRQHFKDATNEKTGLGPDYSEYSGAAKNEGNHGDFRFDAWRIAANIACDYAWWAQDDWATTHANRIQSFFYDQGVDSYGNQWSLDGKNLSPDHSPGLVAMNATASLASSDKKSWSFLEDLWNISPTTGKYRYYDGCLYMMGLLHCSGKFQAYLSSNTPGVGVVNGKISTTTAEFDLSADKKEDVTTKLILNGVRTLSEIRNDKTVLEKEKDYTISGDTVSIRKEYLSKQAVGVTKLTFVFDAGKNAVMSITIKDSKSPDVPDVPAVSGPFDKIKATDCTADSKDIKVEDGKVTLNTTDSYIAFDIDFGSETAQSITTYVKEPNNSGQLFVRIGSLTSNPVRIYNLGYGSLKEINSRLWPTVTGKTKIYIQANKPGVQIDWIQFGK